MNTTDLVHFPSRELPGAVATPSRSALAPSRYELEARVRGRVLCAREYLAAEQRLDGSWAGRTTGEVSALNQFVLLFAYLGREHSELVEQAARAIRCEQLAAGGWARTPGGPFNLDVSVLAYFALKIVGEEACGPEMAPARRAIREAGGADRSASATRNWLALLGQIDYDLCTPVMPEWLFSSAHCLRSTSADECGFTARSVVSALRPRREVGVGRGIRELFVESPRDWRPAEKDAELPRWRIPRSWSRAGFVPFRRKSLERASFLLAEEAIETPRDDADVARVAWQWIALRALGFAESSRAIESCDERLRGLIAVDEIADEARSQPNTPLTADTSLAIQSLAASGVSCEQPVVAGGLRWLVEHRADMESDSRPLKELTMLLEASSAALCAEESSAAGMLPELRIAAELGFDEAVENSSTSLSTDALRQSCQEFCHDLIFAQQPDGGWSADGAGHGARLTGINHGSNGRRGVSTADVTGAALAAIPREGHSYRSAAVRGVSSLRSMQRGDGSWDSAMGARFVHGTANAIRGMISAGAGREDQAVAAGVNWLLVHQHESGGWGESDGRGTDGDHFQTADPTAIQTAWAAAALVSAGMADHDATRRGISFLLDAQSDDGSWRDTQLVERDSPRGAWYRNDLHSTCWSLIAIAKWAVAIAGQADESTATLRLVCHESADSAR
jgi:squalene-hopene/tetraprenyl-beta-curcumene cyclase